MRPIDYLREAANDLRSAKLRTALTSLGIVIGVASVALLLSLGEGVRSQISGAFAELGSRRVMVLPSAPGGSMGAPVASTLTAADVAAIAQLDGVAVVAPVLVYPASVTGPAGELALGVMGTDAAYFEINADTFIAGEPMRADDETVLNETAAEALLGDGGVGETVSIGDSDLTVVGIVADAPPSSFSRDTDPAPTVLIDDRTAAALAGSEHPSQIVLNATEDADVTTVVTAIESLLLTRHDGIEDVEVISFEALAASFAEITGVLTGFLAAIAAISLLVGGIGIMNIMLVVVSERTREIGIAKAIGATRRTIVVQFLVEAIVLSLLGGLVGLGLAWLGLTFVNGAIELSASLSAGTVALALGTSISIGVLFGVAPAYRAARLDPIAALRHE